MILTITLNPCIDKTIYLNRLEVGSYNRVKNTRVDPAGKGLNVSIVLKHLNESTHCMGFNFKNNGSILENVLKNHGIEHSFISVEGDIRTNIKLFDNSCQVMTEINEAGPLVPASAVDEFLEGVDTFLSQTPTDLLVMSGSIPPGVPTHIYQRLIRMAHRRNVKTVLDASGDPLILGLQEKPYLIKPNTLEFEQAFQEDLASGKSTLEIAQKVIEDGIPYICLSMGADGALFIDRDHAYRAKPLPVKPKGLTGAGDSMVAGMCCAILRHLESADILRYAMAAAGGSIRQEGTILAQKKDLDELLPQVEIEMIH